VAVIEKVTCGQSSRLGVVQDRRIQLNVLHRAVKRDDRNPVPDQRLDGDVPSTFVNRGDQYARDSFGAENLAMTPLPVKVAS
jgi:hypothetical protein